MSKLRQIVTILVLFLLLFMVAVTPKIFLEHKNNQMMDKVQVEMNSEYVQESPKDYNNVERLQIIVNSFSKGTGVFTEQNDLTFSDEKMGLLLNQITEQLTILQNKNVLPKFTMSEEYSIDYLNKITCMDRKNPKQVVNFWDIMIINSDYFISLWIDTDTFVIYQIAFVAENSELDLDENNIQPFNFLEYLNINSYQVGYKMNEYGDEIFYYIEQDNLSITCSFQKDTHAIQYYFY